MELRHPTAQAKEKKENSSSNWKTKTRAIFRIVRAKSKKGRLRLEEENLAKCIRRVRLFWSRTPSPAERRTCIMPRKLKSSRTRRSTWMTNRVKERARVETPNIEMHLQNNNINPIKHTKHLCSVKNSETQWERRLANLLYRKPSWAWSRWAMSSIMHQ